jgi:hypothetical protein
MRRKQNSSFSLEFRRCVVQMTNMIQETTERPSNTFNVSILGDETVAEIRDSFDSTMSVDLTPKDIYIRIAANLELIELYANINSKLVAENNPSRLFRETTESLVGIKQALESIII